MVAVTQDLLTLDHGLDASALLNTDVTHIGFALRQQVELAPPNIKVVAIVANGL